ncbi:MAG: SLBB domain-containing protein [candidate division Zixibacteria bacterium]|nr:SLBB domain-containing protein [candidate division Zixibacteria bacterium]
MKFLSIFLGILILASFGWSQDNLLLQFDQPQFDQPVDAAKYIIRPGDELSVVFLKANIEPLKLTVDPEGRIVDENLGMIYLSHTTLDEARQILTQALKELYRVEQISISITKPREVSVSITGAIENPGVYTGYSSERISQLIKEAGGILEDGSSRTIKFSGGPDEIRVDLDLAVFTGDINSDPCLYSGYTLYIPRKLSQRVQVTGEVNFPREIELIEGDDLQRLIALAGGLRSWADSSNIYLLRSGQKLTENINEIKAGDIIIVPSLELPDAFRQLAAFGAVNNPGRYSYDKAGSLKDLISLAGGFKQTASKERTTLFRLALTDEKGRISPKRFSISNAYGASEYESNFSLLPGDSIFVPYFVGYVEVSGNVPNPGTFTFVKGKDSKYYISLAGGFLPDSDEAMVEIFYLASRITSTHTTAVHINDGSRIIVNLLKEEN